MGSYMPTLADYSKVSWIQSQSLALLYRWPKFLDKRKFGSVAHKKLSSICSKISLSSGLLCLYFVSGFIFLCDACCSFQTERRKFLVCYSYIGESLIRWVFNQLKSLTDRSTFFLKNYLEGGGGSRGSKSKETFSGGAALTNSVGRGAGLKKNLQILDLHLWEWSHIINNLHSGQKIPQYPGVPWLSMVLADLFFHYLHKYYKEKMLLAHLQVYWKPWILNWNCGCNCKYLKIDTLTCSLMKEA